MAGDNAIGDERFDLFGLVAKLAQNLGGVLAEIRGWSAHFGG